VAGAVAAVIQAVAKGLGGGYQPIGAVLVCGRVVGALRDGSGAFQHGHTYLAHPTACAAALAVQQVIREDGLLARVREQGALLERLLPSGSATTGMSATYAAAACSKALSLSRTGPRRRRSIPR